MVTSLRNGEPPPEFAKTLDLLDGRGPSLLPVDRQRKRLVERRRDPLPDRFPKVASRLETPRTNAEP